MPDKRGMINTDIPTLENFFTKEHPSHVTTRIAHDGSVNVNRRYAPDDAPGNVHVICIGRLPSSFGRYADGLVMVYATQTIGSVIPGRGVIVGGAGTPKGGWINGRFHKGGNWAWKGEYTVRVAVHEAAANVDGYASGWHVLNWHRDFEAAFKWLSDFDSPDTFLTGSVHFALGRFGSITDPLIFSSALGYPEGSVAAQRMGDWVFFSFGSGNSQPKGLHAHTTDHGGSVYSFDDAWLTANGGGLFRLTPKLEIEHYPGVAVGGTDMFISEGTNPTLWCDSGNFAFQVTASDLKKGITDKRHFAAAISTFHRLLPDAIGNFETAQSRNHPGGGYSNQVIQEQVSGVHPHVTPGSRYVKLFGSGDYDPPEKWFLWPNADLSFTIYRSKWAKHQWVRPFLTRSDTGAHTWFDSPLYSDTAPADGYQDNKFVTGKTRYPRYNRNGWAFEGDWKKSRNIVGHVPALPGYTGIHQSWNGNSVTGAGGSWVRAETPEADLAGRALVDWKILRNENEGSLVLIMVTNDVHGVPSSDNPGGELFGIAGGGYYPPPWIARVVDSNNRASTIPYADPFDPPDRDYSTIITPEVQYGAGYFIPRYGVVPDDYVAGPPDPRSSQIWTSVSYDDGKNWSKPLQVKQRMRPRDGAWATQWAMWQCAGAQSGTQPGILGGGCVLTADGSLVMPVVECFIYGRPAKQAHRLAPESASLAAAQGPVVGGREPFWTGPANAGTRVTLYVPADLSAFGIGKSAPDGVIYKRVRGER